MAMHPSPSPGAGSRGDVPLLLPLPPPQVACGSGLVRIYDFLRADEPSQYPGRDLSRQLDPASVSKAALDGSDPLAGV